MIKSLVKVFRVWCNKEALKMECNRRNRNIRYVIFRDLNFKKLSEYLILQSYIFLYFCDRTWKLKRLFFPFLVPIITFHIFGRFVKRKCRTFLRMALWRKSIFQFLLSHWCKQILYLRKQYFFSHSHFAAIRNH